MEERVWAKFTLNILLVIERFSLKIFKGVIPLHSITNLYTISSERVSLTLQVH